MQAFRGTLINCSHFRKRKTEAADDARLSVAIGFAFDETQAGSDVEFNPNDESDDDGEVLSRS